MCARALRFPKQTPMSEMTEEEVKCGTGRRTSGPVLDIAQGKTTAAPPSSVRPDPTEVESWVEDGKRGMKSAQRARPEDVREQYQRHLKGLQEGFGEAMLEIRTRM